LHFDPDLAGNDRLWHIVADLQQRLRRIKHDRLTTYRWQRGEIDAAQQIFTWFAYACLPTDHCHRKPRFCRKSISRFTVE
jgi:hypothetical protein